MSLIGDAIDLHQVLHSTPAVPRLVPGEVVLGVQLRKEKEKKRLDEDVTCLGETKWASEHTECHLDPQRPRKQGFATSKGSIWVW